MEGHPALPDPDDDEGIGDETRQLVEEHVADPTAEHRAEREVEHDLVDPLRRPATPWVTGGAPPAEPPSEPEADDVGDPVPADRHRPDGDGDGIDLGIGEHVGRADSGGLSGNRDDSRFPAARGAGAPGGRGPLEAPAARRTAAPGRRTPRGAPILTDESGLQSGFWNEAYEAATRRGSAGLREVGGLRTCLVGLRAASLVLRPVLVPAQIAAPGDAWYM